MLVLSDLQTGNVGDVKVCGTCGYVLMCVGATVLGGWMGSKVHNENNFCNIDIPSQNIVP